MIHPIPPGTRDVLPDEMREQRAITDGLHGTFTAAGYGEVWTPTVEYEEVLGTGAGASGYRLFDDQGDVLALRSDMTLPIARLAATRYPDAEPPLRLCYFGHAYRSARRGSGQATEFLQAGIELLGVPGARGRGRGDLGAAGRARGRRPGPPPRRAGRQRAVPRAAGQPGGAGRAPRRPARAAGRQGPGGPGDARGPARPVRRRAQAARAPARDARRARDAGARARGGGPGAGRPRPRCTRRSRSVGWPTG